MRVRYAFSWPEAPGSDHHIMLGDISQVNSARAYQSIKVGVVYNPVRGCVKRASVSVCIGLPVTITSLNFFEWTHAASVPRQDQIRPRVSGLFISGVNLTDTFYRRPVSTMFKVAHAGKYLTIVLWSSIVPLSPLGHIAKKMLSYGTMAFTPSDSNCSALPAGIRSR